MVSKSLQLAFVLFFMLITLIFLPEHSMKLPLSIKAVFSWIGVFILSFLIVKNLIKVEYSDYKEFFVYLASKIPFKDKQFVESKAALRLMSAGLAFWFMILLLKESFFPLPLFVVGAILIVWGGSIFLEDNGLYRFSDSYLSNKWLLSAVGAALIYWASFTSARQVNSVFEIDSGLFPFTLTSMVLLNLIILFSFLY